MFTQKEINLFHKNGIIIAKGLFKGDELIKLQDATAKVVNEGLENTPLQTKDADPSDDYAANKNFDDHLYLVKEDGSHIYRRSERMWERNDIFQAATVNPELLIPPSPPNNAAAILSAAEVPIETKSNSIRSIPMLIRKSYGGWVKCESMTKAYASPSSPRSVL